MTATWPTVMVTGHRPLAMSTVQEAWVLDRLPEILTRLRDVHGTRIAVSGMALGVDQWFAQAALDAGLELHAYIPYPQQPLLWMPSDQRRWRELLDQAAAVHTVGDLADHPNDRGAAVRLLHARNDAMLRASNAVVAVLRSSKQDGGTYSAYMKARRRHPVLWLDPDTSTETLRLPDPAQEGLF